MRSIASLLSLALLSSCGDPPVDAGGTALPLGVFTVRPHPETGTLDIDGPDGPLMADVRFALGDGTQDVEMQTGSFRFSNETYALRSVDRFDVSPRSDGAILALYAGDDRVGQAHIALDEVGLVLSIEVEDGLVSDTPRTRITYARSAEEPILGLGEHAFEIEHHGQAFPLWVSEPGIGKNTSDDDDLNDFPLQGTRHASSYPIPWLLHPERDLGLVVDTTTRVELDLGKTEPTVQSIVAWDDAPVLRLIHGDGVLDVVERFSEVNGRMPLPPRWAFAPWITAVRGADRVRDAVHTFRSRHIPTSVIWTEDWKGAVPDATGFRLSEEWFADDSVYPDLPGLDAELEASGIAWLGYFAPFLGRDTVTVADAIAQDVPIRSPDGTEPYWFLGVRLSDVTLVDLSTRTGRRWAEGYFADLRDQGFEGWMADYAEWLPVDADLASGQDALRWHNDYPRWWQETNDAVLDSSRHVWFCRSGWLRTAPLCPVVWLGDQRTSFQEDDGLPTIVPMALGLNLSGVPIVTHDVAGYQSLTNGPSTRELWYRWAALGAWSPILRTHHGSSRESNHQWNSDEDTLAVWTRLTVDHTATFPYRYGLAARASARGTPMVQPTFLVDDTEPFDRIDAWMLGDAFLVVPVVKAGEQAVDPKLPSSFRWLDVHTGQVASGGPVDVPFPPGPTDRLIAVFQREGTVVPRFTEVPDTLRDLPAEGAMPGITTFADVDDRRTLTVFGAGGTFTEADGTAYAVTGTPDAATTATATLTSGKVQAGGAVIEIRGTVRRTYTIVVVP